METYEEFLKAKSIIDRPAGIEKDCELNPRLIDFQTACTRFSLRRGRSLLAEECGLGKTFQQLEWARVVYEHTNKSVLIVAPLSVAQQTVSEGAKFGINVEYVRSKDEMWPGISITNYEMLHHFDPSEFSGVVLDESSILKNFTGKIRNQVIDMFKETPFKLSCTATPAPNDYMELGNQAEFLGVMTRAEMLATFFVHDGGDTQAWRLKGHAQDIFWRWLASWAVMIKTPADIGFDGSAFVLPKLNTHKHVLRATSEQTGTLFPTQAKTLIEQRRLKKATILQRCEAAAEVVNKTDCPFIIWGELNAETALLEKLIHEAVQVSGSDDFDVKVERLNGFQTRKFDRLVSKCSIAGYGSNWQHCSNMAFVNLTHSWEDQYQAIRRCYRFGQKNDVNVHIFMMDAETAILDNIQRKNHEAEEMSARMREHMADMMKAELGMTRRNNIPYVAENKMEVPSWLKSA